MNVRERHPSPRTPWSPKALSVGVLLLILGFWQFFDGNRDLAWALFILAPVLPVMDWLGRRMALSMHKLRQSPGKDFQVNRPEYYLSTFRREEPAHSVTSKQGELLEKKLHPEHHVPPSPPEDPPS